MSALDETRCWLRYAQEDLRAAEGMIGRECPDLAELTEWAVEADAQSATRSARAVVESVLADLQGRGIEESEGEADKIGPSQ